MIKTNHMKMKKFHFKIKIMKSIPIKYQIDKLKKYLASKKESEYTELDKRKKLLLDCYIDPDKVYFKDEINNN